MSYTTFSCVVDGELTSYIFHYFFKLLEFTLPSFRRHMSRPRSRDGGRVLSRDGGRVQHRRLLSSLPEDRRRRSRKSLDEHWRIVRLFFFWEHGRTGRPTSTPGRSRDSRRSDASNDPLIHRSRSLRLHGRGSFAPSPEALWERRHRRRARRRFTASSGRRNRVSCIANYLVGNLFNFSFHWTHNRMTWV